MQHPPLAIKQMSRFCDTSGGIWKVVLHLHRAFEKKGVPVETTTIADLPAKRLVHPRRAWIPAKLNKLMEILYFTIAGSFHLRRLRRSHESRNTCVLVHTDVLGGDVYVNHGLHKAMLRKRKDGLLILALNPIHILTLFRECFRNRWFHRIFVCFSGAGVREYQEYYPCIPAEKYRTIPNGVDIDHFSPDAGVRKRIRSELGIPEDRFVALFVGHEFRRKGLDIVIKALETCDRPVTFLVVGGTPSLIRSARDKCRDLPDCVQVVFTGRKDDPAPYYRAADAFVMPSFYEAMALVGLEALASGIPLLMTDTGGTLDYLEDGSNGFVVSNDPADVLEKLLRLVDDRVTTETMKRNARRSSLDYSWDAIAERYLDLAKEVVLERNRAA